MSASSTFIQQLERNPIFSNYAYAGCVAGKNGCIYGIPYCATHVLEFNPKTNTIRRVGKDLTDFEEKWHGGTVAEDGCIYGCPYDSDHILKYDPTTETSSLVGDWLIIGDSGKGQRYHSAVSVPGTNCIYFIPANAEKILRYNIVNGETSFVGDYFFDNWQWSDSCLSKVDGCIYCTPLAHGQVLKFDPIDESTTLIGEVYGSRYTEKWNGCVEGVDGNIYCTPKSIMEHQVMKIDVKAGVTSLVGKKELERAKFSGWYSGCVKTTLHDTEYILMPPMASNRTVMFDTDNESHMKIGQSVVGEHTPPVISSHDRCVYAFPCGRHDRILKIDLSVLDSIHVATAAELPWSLLKPIAEGNINALEEGHTTTGLLPFMIAAEKCSDDHCEGALGSLTIVFELLSLKPAVLKHYVSTAENNNGDTDKERKRPRIDY